MNKIWNLPAIECASFEQIDDQRPALLVTSAPAWDAVKEHLRGLRIACTIEIMEASIVHWDARLSSIEEARSSVVYAVGGGLAADAAKYLAARLKLPLVCLPTALSVDAFLTWASGVRRAGCVEYIETGPPERLIVDFDVIAAAPASLRAAGLTDILSIATGSWDWKFAHECGRNPPGQEFLPWAYNNAQTILDGALDCAEAAGRGDRGGLKTLLDCLCLEVQLCNQLGHARPEEGSEHYFAYAVENELRSGLPHGDLVGPGILLIARLQGQDPTRLEKALRAGHIPLENIPLAVIERTLKILPAYCARHRLPYGIAHTV